MRDKSEEVKAFIRVFASPSNIELYNNCACYWFAKMLKDRFSASCSCILYNPEEVHFVACIDHRLYDINGEISDRDGYVMWQDYLVSGSDATEIYKNCVQIV